MSLMGLISKQFIEVIQWTEDGPGTLAWRFPTTDLEIQNGAALTVRETQAALFVNEGRLADLFAPGRYTLTTENLPVLTSLENWGKLFKSPFKSDVYFFSTRDQTDQRWGTAQPITVRDKELGPLRIRANGVYSYRVGEPRTFFARLSGTTPRYTVDDASGQLRAAIVTAIASGIGGSEVPFLDMAANQTQLSDKLHEAIEPVFLNYGLQLTGFFLESLSLPEEVQTHLDRRSSMQVIGDLDRYTRFEAADSLHDAAVNPGGVAGIGAGLGAGLALAQTMTQNLVPQPAPDPLATIERLGELFKKGILTEAEFTAKKAELLKQIS